jgi:hypothetical protein
VLSMVTKLDFILKHKVRLNYTSHITEDLLLPVENVKFALEQAIKALFL